MEYETTTALQEGNQSVGTAVFNATTAPSPSPGVVYAQSHGLNIWYNRQIEMSPTQFLSQARQSHVITIQQYHALLKDRGAQAEFTENYKRQLGTIATRDESGNISGESLGKLSNVKVAFDASPSLGLQPSLRDEPA
jgi:hypothetical protein